MSEFVAHFEGNVLLFCRCDKGESDSERRQTTDKNGGLLFHTVNKKDGGDVRTADRTEMFIQRTNLSYMKWCRSHISMRSGGKFEGRGPKKTMINFWGSTEVVWQILLLELKKSNVWQTDMDSASSWCCRKHSLNLKFFENIVSQIIFQ